MKFRHLLILSALLCFSVQALLLLTKYYFIAPILPLGVVGLLLLYRFPQAGFLLLAFSIPFEGLFAGNKFFTGAKLLGAALIFVGAAKILLQQIPLSRLKTPLSWPIFFLVTSFLLSSLFSPSPEVSLHMVRQITTAISIFYITLLFYNQLNLVHLARTVVSSVAATAAIALLIGSTDATERTVGLLEDPNFFALLLICAIPLVLYLIIHETSYLYRLIWGMLFVVMLVAFQKTMSRSGLLILVASVGLLGLNYRYILKKLTPSQLGLAVTTSLIAMLIGISILPQEYRERILSLASISSGVHDYEDRSLSRRSSYIIVGVQVFRDNPFLGVGPGIFPLKYAQSGYASAYTVDADSAELYRRAHNTYLETLTETGLIGLISLLFLLGLGTLQYWRTRRDALQRGQTVQVHIITHYGVSLISIAMFFLFLSALTNKYLWIYLAIGCGFASQMQNSPPEITHGEAGSSTTSQ